MTGVKMARLINYMIKTQGRAGAMNFMQSVS